MITAYKTQVLNYSNDIDDLLCQIDVKLVKMARNKFDSERFGAKTKISVEDYDLLYKYREYLYRKAKGSCCLRNILVDDLISRIKQLLNRN